MADDRRVYYSLRNQGLYHTCANCNVGRQIDPEVRKVSGEKQAQTKGLKKCRRCVVLDSDKEGEAVSA